MAYKSLRLFAGALLASLFSLGLMPSGTADDAKTSRSRSDIQAEKKQSQASVSFRLPRYFASIIDDEQRDQMREIQANYYQKIAALQKELSALEAAQLGEMEDVLTSSQRKTLQELRAGSSQSGNATARTAPAKESGGANKSPKKSAGAKPKTSSSESTKGSRKTSSKKG